MITTLTGSYHNGLWTISVSDHTTNRHQSFMGADCSEVMRSLESFVHTKQRVTLALPDKPATVREPIRAIEENVQKLDAYLRQCRVGILHGARPIRGDVLSILRNYVSDIQRGIEHDTALDALLEQPGHDDNQIPF